MSDGEQSTGEMVGVDEPHWHVLASGPALVEALTRAGARATPSRANRGTGSAESPAVTTTHTDTSHADGVVAGHDGLMDSWPSDMSRAGRWWWNVRLHAGRLVADLRQGRMRFPRNIEPRIAVGLLVAFGVVLAISAVGTLVGTHLAGSVTVPNFGAGAAPQPTTGIVLQTNPGSGAPTVVVAPYTMAVWVSNSAPGSFGTVQVYVRVTNSTTFVAQPGVSVGLSVAFTCATANNVQGYGPSATDMDGMATFTVAFSNLPVGQPVCITARASIGAQSFTGTATFAAGGGIIVPTATPENPNPTPTPKKHKG